VFLLHLLMSLGMCSHFFLLECQDKRRRPVLGATNENRLRKKENTQGEEKGAKAADDAPELTEKTPQASSAEEKGQGNKEQEENEIEKTDKGKEESINESKNRSPSSSRTLERTDSSLSSPTLPAILRMPSIESPNSPVLSSRAEGDDYGDEDVDEDGDEDGGDEMEEELPIMLPTMCPQLERQQGFYDESTSRRAFTGMPNFNLQGLGQGLGGGSGEEVQIHG